MNVRHAFNPTHTFLPTLQSHYTPRGIWGKKFGEEKEGHVFLKGK
jgi:hypothetical protein